MRMIRFYYAAYCFITAFHRCQATAFTLMMLMLILFVCRRFMILPPFHYRRYSDCYGHYAAASRLFVTYIFALFRRRFVRCCRLLITLRMPLDTMFRATLFIVYDDEGH